MWIGSIMPLSALFGGIAGGPFIEYFGRRNTILGTAVPFIVGKRSELENSFSISFVSLFVFYLPSFYFFLFNLISAL